MPSYRELRYLGATRAAAQEKEQRAQDRLDLDQQKFELEKKKFELEQQLKEMHLKEIEADLSIKASEINKRTKEAELEALRNDQMVNARDALAKVDTRLPSSIFNQELNKIAMANNAIPTLDWDRMVAPLVEANKRADAARIDNEKFLRQKQEALEIERKAKELKLTPSSMHAQTSVGNTMTFTNPKEQAVIKPAERIKMQGELAGANDTLSRFDSEFQTAQKSAEKYNQDLDARKQKASKSEAEKLEKQRLPVHEDITSWLSEDPQRAKAYRDANAKKASLVAQISAFPKDETVASVPSEQPAPAPTIPAVTDDPTKHIYSKKPGSRTAADYPNAPVISDEAAADDLPFGQVFVLQKPNAPPVVAWKNPAYALPQKTPTSSGSE